MSEPSAVALTFRRNSGTDGYGEVAEPDRFTLFLELLQQNAENKKGAVIAPFLHAPGNRVTYEVVMTSASTAAFGRRLIGELRVEAAIG